MHGSAACDRAFVQSRARRTDAAGLFERTRARLLDKIAHLNGHSFIEQ
jgi:hypothetical protein